MIDLSCLSLTRAEETGIREAAARLSPAAREIMAEGAAAYRDSIRFDYTRYLERIAGETVPEEGHFLFVLTLLPVLRAYYGERGFPGRYFDGVLRDVRVKLRECYAMRGLYGTFVPWWFHRWFSLRLIALKRLQFEIRRYDFTVSLPGWRFAGGDLINVHIPGEGPLSREACLQDYAEAACLFGDHFSGDKVPFHCHSWLLHPEHPAFLDPNSRILAFQADYTIFEFEETDPASFLWRLFLVPYDGDPAHLPARNSLEKAYRDRLLAGGSVGEGRGVFLWQKV